MSCSSTGPLSEIEIKQLYEDQSAWVEERSRFEVTVDNDLPTTSIRSTLVYRLNQPAILDVYANDPTSPLYKVELLTNGSAKDAALCVGSDGISAYCPTFTPSGEGRYQLQSRAGRYRRQPGNFCRSQYSGRCHGADCHAQHQPGCDTPTHPPPQRVATLGAATGRQCQRPESEQR